jgi:hypothetical protein
MFKSRRLGFTVWIKRPVEERSVRNKKKVQLSKRALRGVNNEKRKHDLVIKGKDTRNGGVREWRWQIKWLIGYFELSS